MGKHTLHLKPLHQGTTDAAQAAEFDLTPRSNLSSTPSPSNYCELLVIQPDGSRSSHRILTKNVDFRTLDNFINGSKSGYIQPITLSDGRIAYVHEEGLVRQLPVNPTATQMIRPLTSVLIPYGGLRGTVVIVEKFKSAKEVKP